MTGIHSYSSFWYGTVLNSLHCISRKLGCFLAQGLMLQILYRFRSPVQYVPPNSGLERGNRPSVQSRHDSRNLLILVRSEFVLSWLGPRGRVWNILTLKYCWVWEAAPKTTQPYIENCKTGSETFHRIWLKILSLFCAFKSFTLTDQNRLLRQFQSVTVTGEKWSAYLGWLHSLSADCTPAPQVRVQWDQVLHWPQPPFTVSGSFPTTTHSPEMHHYPPYTKEKLLHTIWHEYFLLS